MRVSLPVPCVAAATIHTVGVPTAAMRRGNDVMQSQRFADDLFHRHSRIERRIWILKNDLRFAPESAQFLLAKCENAAPLEPDVARHWFDQPQYQASDRRFAATGFT